MKGRRKYFNKVPPFTPCPEHWTRKGARGWKAKIAYGSEEAAWEWLGQCPRPRSRGYTAYQCPVCQKWHVGREQVTNKKQGDSQ